MFFMDEMWPSVPWKPCTPALIMYYKTSNEPSVASLSVALLDTPVHSLTSRADELVLCSL